MEHTPFFSVIIPTYNRAEKLKLAIESVLSQTFNEFEIIVVDDGSTDHTRKMVETYTDTRIRYIFQQNKERSAARNSGIKNARGAYVCFLDSDDVYLPHHLSVLRREINMMKEAVGLFCTGLLRANSEGIVTGHPIPYGKNIHPVHFIWRYFLLPDAVCAHKKVFDYHLFDERFRIWEDTHLWLRLAAAFPVFFIREYTAVQQAHNESTVELMFSSLKQAEIRQYIEAIDDLFLNFKELVEPHLSDKDKEEYVARKYTMFQGLAMRSRNLSLVYRIIFWRYKRDRRIPALVVRIVKASYKFCTVSLRYLFKSKM